MGKPSNFGDIPGYPVGSAFATRSDLRAAGLHRHLMNGISGNYADGADAIVVSGGYPDDEDNGDSLIYTGEGGQLNNGKKHVQDQTLIRGNLALVVSENRGLPVRVVRGAAGDPKHAPNSGYRYDGLFTVVRHWSAPSGGDGPLVYRYELAKVASEGGGASKGWEGVLAGTSGQPPKGTQAPGRRVGVVQRVIRNTKVTQWVKDLYDSECQFCGTRLVANGVGYAEGAHVRALGSPHNGDDEAYNVLCLCPNDHVLFDKGAIYVEDGKLLDTETRKLIRSLHFKDGHNVSAECLAYHREKFAGIT